MLDQGQGEGWPTAETGPASFLRSVFGGTVPGPQYCCRARSCDVCRLLPLVMPGEGKEEPGQPRAFEHLTNGMIEPRCPSEGSQR